MFHKEMEDWKSMAGGNGFGTLRPIYAAQVNAHIDAEIGKKGRFQMETN